MSTAFWKMTTGRWRSRWRIRLLLRGGCCFVVGRWMEPVHDCMQMRTNVSYVGCLGTFTTVLWIKVSGQNIVDYVDSTVNHLKSI
jgi:hypothetical protein